ncbi:hypothetical protein, partial [Porphyromonas asaccharolytica]
LRPAWTFTTDVWHARHTKRRLHCLHKQWSLLLFISLSYDCSAAILDKEAPATTYHDDWSLYSIGREVFSSRLSRLSCTLY